MEMVFLRDLDNNQIWICPHIVESLDRFDLEMFTGEVTKELKDIFDYIDTDCSGFITVNKLETVLTSLGVEYKKNLLREIVHNIDSTKEGLISYKDFLKIFSENTISVDFEIELIQTFRLFDHEDKGMITVDSLKKVLYDIGETLTDQEIEEMIEVGDYDQDGVVGREDFFQLMKCIKHW